MAQQRTGDLPGFLAAAEGQKLRLLRAQRLVDGLAEGLGADAGAAERGRQIALAGLSLPQDRPRAAAEQAVGLVRALLPAQLLPHAAAADGACRAVKDQGRGRLRLRKRRTHPRLEREQHVRRLIEGVRGGGPGFGCRVLRQRRQETGEQRARQHPERPARVFAAPDEHAQKIHPRKYRRPRQLPPRRETAGEQGKAEAGRLRRARHAAEIQYQPAGRADGQRLRPGRGQHADRRRRDHGQRHPERQLHPHEPREQTHGGRIRPQPRVCRRGREHADAQRQQDQPQNELQRRLQPAVRAQDEDDAQQRIDPARRGRGEPALLVRHQIGQQTAARQQQKPRRHRLQRRAEAPEHGVARRRAEIRADRSRAERQHAYRRERQRHRPVQQSRARQHKAEAARAQRAQQPPQQRPRGKYL